MAEFAFARSAHIEGSEIDRVFVAGQEADFVFGQGAQLFPNIPVPIYGSLATRVLLESGQKWLEVGFTIDTQLSGNAAAGWVDAGNYVRFEPEWSPDLINWSAGKFLPAPVPVITNGNGTWTYWMRAIHPIDSAVKSGMLQVSSGAIYGQAGILGNTSEDERNNPFTALTILGVSRALGGFPYTMPTDAARMQADLAAIFPGATVEASSATVWRILIPGINFTAFSQLNKITWPTYLVADMFGIVNSPVTGAFFDGNFVNADGIAILPNTFARLKMTSGTRYGANQPISIEVAEFGFVEIAATPVLRQIPGSFSTVTIADRIMNRVVSGTTYYDQSLAVTYSGNLPEPVTWSSSNPAVATVDSAGFLTHHSAGNVIITATAGTASISRTFILTVSSSTTDALVDYSAASLAKHVSDQIDGRIASLTPAQAMALYTTADHATPSYVRNPDAWPEDIAQALTCISPWNSTGGNKRGGVAISPWHVIFAPHYPIGLGATIRFVTAADEIVTRTITAVVTHPDYVPYYPDLAIGILDSALPTSITPAHVLPDDWASKLPSLSASCAVPALCLDQEGKALVTDLAGLGASASFAMPAGLGKAARLLFYEDKIKGDSGQPAFLLINGQAVIVTVWTSGGAGSGTFITPHRAAINAMMASGGGAHVLQSADLAEFPDYA